LLAQTPKGEVMLSWTEKDAQGMTSFCLAFSKDKGKTFSEKKTIYSGIGINNSRMMRAKVLAKKDGSLVAVFSNRGEGGGRSSNIVHCLSKDGGTTWTAPVSIDSDPKQGIVRGFFDAVVMSNEEVAVVYLKDVENSTKHEERNLRLVTTKNEVFLPERVIDPVVCDCCPINMLIDADGTLNVIYRDNNDDIRDMAQMISTDNAATFSKPKIVHNDGWKINGCPHSGAVSSIYGKSALIAWFSGSEKESGVRLATREGKKLFVLSDASAKNPCLVDSPKSTVMFWEQNTNDNVSKIAYRKINNDKVSETIWLDGSSNGINPVALDLTGRYAASGELHNQLLVAYEVKQANKRNTIKISTVSL
jgi:BNR repeat-like domain